MDALRYARELVAFDSVSRRSNADVADYVARTLRSLDFETEHVEYDDAYGVKKVNVIGRMGPGLPGGLAYFCHSDVVPAGDWFDDQHGPFQPVERDGRLYGRGSCDMKGSLAAMLAAASALPAGALDRPLYVVCTADEEVGFLGATIVAQRSRLYEEIKTGVAAGIIGEPTSLEVVTAHKGSCAMRIESRGEAAHSSSASGLNANLAIIPFLAEMHAIYHETETDAAWQDDRFDPPTVSWNIGVNDHNPAINVKAARSVATIYFRPAPGMNVTPLVERTRQCAADHGLAFEIFFEAKPFWLDPQAQVAQTMLELTGARQTRTVCYGTDAAVFSELGRVVVCGPGSIAQAHTRDEWIALDQLQRGTDLYGRAIRHWCCNA